MSVTDILTRANALYKKYEKYDAEKAASEALHKNDRFMQEYTELEADIRVALQKSEEASKEKNRAVAATLNAEVRRSKGAMQAKLPKLHKHALKKVSGVKPEDLALRPDMAAAIAARIEAISDGIVVPSKPQKRGFFSKPPPVHQEIKIDSMSPDEIMNAGQQQNSEESEKFSQEIELRKKKQDESLDIIAQGLTTLGSMSQDINEELDKQTPLVDEIDTKINKAQAIMKSTNARLKENLLKLRTTRNFAVDLVLLMVVLGIAAYLFKVISAKLKKK